MNRLLIRMGLGIVIYLPLSVLDSRSSSAVSLKFSDRYELTKLNDETPNNGGLSLIPSNFDSDYSNQSPLQTSSEFNLSSTQAPQDSSSTENITDLFLGSTYNIQVQTGTESEDQSLLEYVTNSLRNIQFNSVGSNSFANPNVIVLPQVAYEDIYRGLYDFEIDVTANPSTGVPRVVDNSIPEEFLISQESIRNYEPQLVGFQPLSDSADGNILPGRYASTISAVLYESTESGANNSGGSSSAIQNLYGGNIRAVLNNNSYEDLSTRVGSVLPSTNASVFTNIEDIEIESNYKTVSAFQKFQNQKDPRQIELEEQLAEQQEKSKEQREKILDKIRKDQRKRNLKRIKEEKKLRQKKAKELSKQREKLQETLEKQRDRFSN
ncbi:hypothetical protein H1P_1450021 [Hyella patelloides LEGE 07179]|uniref:Uncharacterized protein n=1 Tax=Hyella patelloides LEGE 07179 TaxID=945734 RepID=A0A563VM48_9CYAN|nr:hypothetical protein [Hyella patelloides]VEP12365.1 hypothetical protein H1P_1450021 [Hyella patelloides LEGE 07179]